MAPPKDATDPAAVAMIEEYNQNVRLQGSGVPGLCGFHGDSLGILYTGGGGRNGAHADPHSSQVSFFLTAPSSFWAVSVT